MSMVNVDLDVFTKIKNLRYLYQLLYNTYNVNSCYKFFLNSFDLPEEWHEVN